MLFACPVSGSCGRPSEAVSTTVPVSGGTDTPLPGAPLLRLASSCAGVRPGRSGAACAAGICNGAITAAVTATTAPGTAQRACLLSDISPSPVLLAPIAILTPVFGCCGHAESLMQLFAWIGET